MARCTSAFLLIISCVFLENILGPGNEKTTEELQSQQVRNKKNTILNSTETNPSDIHRDPQKDLKMENSSLSPSAAEVAAVATY